MAEDFWAARRYMLRPIPEIFQAADLLNSAADAHLNGNGALAADLLRQADMPVLSQWTEALWGAQNKDIHRFRPIENLPPLQQKSQQRMPDAKIRKALIERDGYHCRYCGIPVVRQETRNRIRKLYPDALRWAAGNKNQHAAFQCLWLTYEHVVPHCRGGDNSLQNMIISCQACNCAKMNYTIEEVGLYDPRNYEPVKSDWDGLERFK